MQARATVGGEIPRQRHGKLVVHQQQAADALLSLADRVADAGIEPMSMADIQAEVQATRQEQRGRPTHDAVVAELMRRPGGRQEVERIEREEDTRAEEFMLKDVTWGLRGQD